MNKRLLTLLLLAVCAIAQPVVPKRAELQGPKTAIYEFRNVDEVRAGEIVDFVRQLDPKVIITWNPAFRTAILHPAPNSLPPVYDFAEAMELLKRYDVAASPAPRIEFVAYVVKAAKGVPGVAPTGEPIPPVIQDAIGEMKGTFAYKDVTLLDTVVTDVRHHAEIENMVLGTHQGPNGPAPYFYQISYGETALLPDGKTVVVNPFKFTLRIPAEGSNTYQNTGITSDLAIKEGQKLVLGKLRTAFYSDPADVFVVLTVKLH